jgi:putative transposase
MLEPRRRIDRALLAVVMEADVHGTPPRSMTWSRPWASMLASQSEVSRICAELDARWRRSARARCRTHRLPVNVLASCETRG